MESLIWSFIGLHLHLVTACTLCGDVLLLRAYVAYRRNTLRIVSGEVTRNGLSVWAVPAPGAGDLNWKR